MSIKRDYIFIELHIGLGAINKYNPHIVSVRYYYIAIYLWDNTTVKISQRLLSVIVFREKTTWLCKNL